MHQKHTWGRILDEVWIRHCTKCCKPPFLPEALHNDLNEEEEASNGHHHTLHKAGSRQADMLENPPK